MKCRDAQKKASVLSRETREYEERREFLQTALESGAQSSRLMVHMETEARTKLSRELDITNDLYHKLSGQVETYKSKLEEEELKFRQIPEYATFLSLEEKVASMETQVSEERAKVAAARERLRTEEEVGDAGGGSWGEFKSCCVALAGKWLECRANMKELVNLKTQQRNLEIEMRALEIHENVAPSNSKFLHGKKKVEANIGDVMEVEDVYETPQESPEKENGTDKMSVRDFSIPPSNPSTIAPPGSAGVSSVNRSTIVPNTTFGQLSLKPPTLPSSSAQSSSLMEGPLDGSALDSSESVRPEPPTPRTKSLHLNLGTSLLNLKNLKKSRKSPNSSPVTSAIELAVNENQGKEDDGKLVTGGSQVQFMKENHAMESAKTGDTDRSKEKSSTSRSRPSSPIPRLINAMFNNKTDEEPKLKSFRLGFPSMFQKKTGKYSVNNGDCNEERVSVQEAIPPPASVVNASLLESSDAEKVKESPAPQFSLLGKFAQSTPKPPLMLNLPSGLKSDSTGNRAASTSHPSAQESDVVMPSSSTQVEDQPKMAQNPFTKNLPQLKLSLPSNLKSSMTHGTSDAVDNAAAAAAIKDCLQKLGSQSSKSVFLSSNTSTISNSQMAPRNSKSPRMRASRKDMSPFKASTAPSPTVTPTKNVDEVPTSTQKTPLKSDQRHITKEQSAFNINSPIGSNLFQSSKESPVAGGLFDISQGESDGIFGISQNQGQLDGSFVFGADTSGSKDSGGLFDFCGNKSEAWNFNTSNDDNEEGSGGFFGSGGAGVNAKDSGHGTFSFFGSGNEEEDRGPFNLF